MISCMDVTYNRHYHNTSNHRDTYRRTPRPETTPCPTACSWRTLSWASASSAPPKLSPPPRSPNSPPATTRSPFHPRRRRRDPHPVRRPRRQRLAHRRANHVDGDRQCPHRRRHHRQLEGRIPHLAGARPAPATRCTWKPRSSKSPHPARAPTEARPSSAAPPSTSTASPSPNLHPQNRRAPAPDRLMAPTDDATDRIHITADALRDGSLIRSGEAAQRRRPLAAVRSPDRRQPPQPSWPTPPAARRRLAVRLRLAGCGTRPCTTPRASPAWSEAGTAATAFWAHMGRGTPASARPHARPRPRRQLHPASCSVSPPPPHAPSSLLPLASRNVHRHLPRARWVRASTPPRRSRIQVAATFVANQADTLATPDAWTSPPSPPASPSPPAASAPAQNT